MNYNKKGQPYVIEGRFRLTELEGEVEYCRVRFLQTGYTKAVPSKFVKTGDFDDSSILHEFLEEENMTLVIPTTPKPVTLVHKGEAPKPKTLELKTDNLSNSVTLVDNNVIKQKEFVAIATSPKGKEIKVADIEAFCKVHNLDLEAVQAVLEGEQKTHKRWRFTKA
ncbi:hypothetical protein [Bacillus cereus]|uniref:Phage protein n=1 Tax=Bacillus cereus TaxID=1396 RepID=A0ABD4LM04_BACCE|nr:hypothetical protein [Bacillus cereus]MBK1611824.1 hypothetical protein [Bacillus cereus]